MQIVTCFSLLLLGYGAMAQTAVGLDGIMSFYCQSGDVVLEKSDGICSAAGGTLEPLNGCCMDTAAVPDAAAAYAQGCRDNGGTVSEGARGRCGLVMSM